MIVTRAIARQYNIIKQEPGENRDNRVVSNSVVEDLEVGQTWEELKLYFGPRVAVKIEDPDGPLY